MFLIKAVAERYQEGWRNTYCARLFNRKNTALSEAGNASRNDDCVSQLSYNKPSKYIWASMSSTIS